MNTMLRYGYFFGIYLLLASCTGRSGGRAVEDPAALQAVAPLAQDPASILAPVPLPDYGRTATELRLDSLGLVDIRSVDERIAVHLVYATADNFMGEVLYEDITKAYLLPEAAEKLSRAQDILEGLHPGYRLLVYDAARPMSVQRKMRRLAEATGKHYYVADPARGGGLHNYGAAVDLTILDADGVPLPMGTAYDHLGYEANTDKEQQLVDKGIITQQELRNRLLLRRVMRQAGFTTVQSEWWHFNHTSRARAMDLYPLIDF